MANHETARQVLEIREVFWLLGSTFAGACLGFLFSLLLASRRLHLGWLFAGAPLTLALSYLDPLSCIACAIATLCAGLFWTILMILTYFNASIGQAIEEAVDPLRPAAARGRLPK